MAVVQLVAPSEMRLDLDCGRQEGNRHEKQPILNCTLGIGVQFHIFYRDVMSALSWREIDFASVTLAGLIGGYVMAMAGLWAGRIPGFVVVDIADFGRRYIVSDRPSAWYFGLASHLANSVILVFAWASLIEPRLNLFAPLEGMIWGGFLAMLLAGALVAPMSGLGLLGWKTGNARFAVTSTLLHLMWGAMIGAIYTPVRV